MADPSPGGPVQSLGRTRSKVPEAGFGMQAEQATAELGMKKSKIFDEKVLVKAGFAEDAN